MYVLMDCKHKTKKGCSLIYSVVNEWRMLSESSCRNHCGVNDAVAQAKMVKRLSGSQARVTDQADALSQLPSKLAQVGWLKKHVIEIAKYKREHGGEVFVTDEHKVARLGQCDLCDKVWKNNAGHLRCSVCGCHLAEIVGVEVGKADFVALKCENKGKNWVEVDKKF